MNQRFMIGGILALHLIATAGCASMRTAHHKGWFILQWSERPPTHPGAAEQRAGDVTRFEQVLSYDRGAGEETFARIRSQLKEGDVLAFRMSHAEVGEQLAAGGVTKIGYELLEYGHLAILVENPAQPGDLRLFASTTFRGPNLRDDLATLQSQNWDVYRLDQWGRVNVGRLHEFVRLAIRKSGKWYGYDFAGVVGLWNLNLTPRTPDEVRRTYICTTLIVAALAYSGVELDVVRRHGIADLISPKRVVLSQGRLVAPPDATLVAGPAPK